MTPQRWKEQPVGKPNDRESVLFEQIFHNGDLQAFINKGIV